MAHDKHESCASFMLRKNYLGIAFIIFLIFCCGFFFFLTQSKEKETEFTMSLRDYLVQSFIAELPSINRNLPRKIDEKTSLISIAFDGTKVISTYVLHNLFNGNRDKVDFVNKAKPILQKQGCQAEAKRSLIEVNVDFLERYQDVDDKFIFEVNLNKSLCARFVSVDSVN